MRNKHLLSAAVLAASLLASGCATVTELSGKITETMNQASASMDARKAARDAELAERLYADTTDKVMMEHFFPMKQIADNYTDPGLELSNVRAVNGSATLDHAKVIVVQTKMLGDIRADDLGMQKIVQRYEDYSLNTPALQEWLRLAKERGNVVKVYRGYNSNFVYPYYTMEFKHNADKPRFVGNTFDIHVEYSGHNIISTFGQYGKIDHILNEYRSGLTEVIALRGSEFVRAFDRNHPKALEDNLVRVID